MTDNSKFKKNSTFYGIELFHGFPKPQFKRIKNGKGIY